MTKQSDQTWHYQQSRHHLAVSQHIIDSLTDDSPLRGIFESYEHRAWLDKITENVNRRLGHKQHESRTPGSVGRDSR